MDLLNFCKSNIRIISLYVALFVLILLPLYCVFEYSIFSDGHFSLDTAINTIADSENTTMILNSLMLAVGVVILTTIIATPLAYLFSRTSFARHGIFDVIFLVPFMTPPYIASMGWILFMQKRGLLEQLFPTTKIFNQYFFSIFGLIVVMSLHIFPFMVMILKNAMLNIPQSLEESGAVFGASFIKRIRKLFLPLITSNYAIGALLIFVKTLSEYGTPATLGKRIGFEVFTTQIHRFASIAPIDFGKAATLSSVLISICIGLWLIQNYLSKKRTYNLVDNKASRFKLIELKGFIKVISSVYVGLIITVSILVPYFSIISTSLIKLRGYGLRAGNFTFDNYLDLIYESDKGVSALVNSFVISVFAAVVCAILGTFIVMTIRTSTFKYKKSLEAISLIPQMLPGIVIVIGIMLFYNSIYQYFPVYNTLWIIAIAYIIQFLPFTVQYVTSASNQVSENLINAGYVFGGSKSFTFVKITLPLIFKGVIAGFMMTFIIGLRELVTPSLIAPPNTLVVSTFIMREFEQGSVSSGMAMAVICVLVTTTALIALKLLVTSKLKKKA